MDFSQAVRFSFEDKEWQSKIVILTLMMAASIVPLAGLLPLVIALGYAVTLSDNVRNGLPRPLPKWDNYGAFAGRGANVLLALILYNLPLLILNACALAAIGGIGRSLFGGAVSLAFLCCTVPLVLIYGVLVWPLLAVSVTRYGASGNRAQLYRPLESLAIVRGNVTATIQWMLHSFAVILLTILLSLIPCCGWILVLALGIPVQSHLLGQYALNLGRAPLAPH